MNKKIFEAGEIPEDETVYLKKDLLGWRVVEPIKDPKTNKISFFRLLFGSKRNLVILIILMILFELYYIGTVELLSAYKKVVDNPCEFCEVCHNLSSQERQAIINQYTKKLNLTYLEKIIVNNG